MKAWEQIAFAIALAIFGWLLFSANKKIGGNNSVTQAPSDGGGVAPWYLTYNSSAGLTGPLLMSGVTSGGLAAPNLTIGQDESNVDNTSGWTQFPNWVQV